MMMTAAAAAAAAAAARTTATTIHPWGLTLSFIPFGWNTIFKCQYSELNCCK